MEAHCVDMRTTGLKRIISSPLNEQNIKCGPFYIKFQPQQRLCCNSLNNKQVNYLVQALPVHYLNVLPCMSSESGNTLYSLHFLSGRRNITRACLCMVKVGGIRNQTVLLVCHNLQEMCHH